MEALHRLSGYTGQREPQAAGAAAFDRPGRPQDTTAAGPSPLTCCAALPPRAAAMPINEKDYVTPEAFSVKPELLGTPLARPRKRLMAWAIDALIVAVIGTLSNILLALALAL